MTVAMYDGTTYTFDAWTGDTILNKATLDTHGSVTVMSVDKDGNRTEVWMTSTAIRQLAMLAGILPAQRPHPDEVW